ncbi:hypothetical protein [Streptomyces sp. NPDC021096]|uniref:hypothetical protein n=1 Tax=Streptomyces sp. NPDC021096 TaxID=3154792 RepID=UPI0033DB6926
MRGPESWPRRTAEGLLCACVCLLLGIAGHGAAGGHLPGAGALLRVLAALSVLGTAVRGVRRLRFDAAVLLAGGAQFALHFVLHLLSSSSVERADGSGHVAHHSGSSAGHHMAAHALPTGRMCGEPPGAGAGCAEPWDLPGPLGAETNAAGGVGHEMTAAMTAGHALATLGTAVCLLFGERILRRIAGLLLRGLHCPVLATSPVPPTSRVPAPGAPLRLSFGALLARGIPRRGPPSLLPA